MKVEPDLLVLDAALHFSIRQGEAYTNDSGEKLARRWLTAVAGTLTSLLDFPFLSPVSIVHQRSGIQIRQRAIKGFRKYLILYHVDQARNVVVVINIVYGTQDIERALGQVPFQEDEE